LLKPTVLLSYQFFKKDNWFWNFEFFSQWLSRDPICNNMPPPRQVDLWSFDLESGVRVTCDVGYLCANFSLPKPLCSRLRPDVSGRQTSDTHHRLIIGVTYWLEALGQIT